ncbi:MAG TPA: hypothetical protein DEX10_05475 [Betaproteobacteria bacterium]|nr:hypothetical protein [Betaproteobacteria bacterium]
MVCATSFATHHLALIDRTNVDLRFAFGDHLRNLRKLAFLATTVLQKLVVETFDAKGECTTS